MFFNMFLIFSKNFVQGIEHT